MAGDDEDASSLITCGEVVFERFATEESCAVFPAIAGHLAELRQLPTEIAVELLQQKLALGEGQQRIG
jgi:hypothetical protein